MLEICAPIIRWHSQVLECHCFKIVGQSWFPETHWPDKAFRVLRFSKCEPVTTATRFSSPLRGSMHRPRRTCVDVTSSLKKQRALMQRKSTDGSRVSRDNGEWIGESFYYRILSCDRRCEWRNNRGGRWCLTSGTEDLKRVSS